MALKTREVETGVDSKTTLLELALYKKYTWGGITYEQGKLYRFKDSDALILLSERDTDRPIWKIHRQVKAKATPTNEVDATRITAPQPFTDDGILGLDTPPKAKRIDVGTDDEIADILSRPDEGGDVTV